MRSNLPENQECRLIKDLESSENPFIILLMMTCCRDNLDLVGIAVPCGLQCAVQQNASLLINLDTLEEREDIYSDDNDVWMQNACKTKYFTTTQTTDDHVLGSPGFHKMTSLYSDVVMFTSHAQLITSSWSTIEDGKQIKQWYPIVLLQYSYDEDE